jgi:DNA-binding NarL/FixJ family response regulator
LRERAHQSGMNDVLVFLDLNMPGMNGHEFLAELRADAELQRTIVFVLTTSDHDRDIQRAYEQNVAGYFLKSEIDSLIAAISGMQWT